jgi:HJR/Mrr/RecB family endonuclease
MAGRRYYKRRHYNDDDYSFRRFIAGIVGLVFLGLVAKFWSNPLELAGYLTTIGIVVIGLYFLAEVIIYRIKKGHRDALLSKLKNAGQQEYLKNFISRFGLEGGKKEGWEFRNHKFEWDRINDLKKIFRENGITSNDKDVFTILRFYIQEKEEAVTRESISKEPQKLANLSGSDFEKLLYRLFEAMGYKVEWIGKSGDQGGDLIANGSGERILIQAKCYRDWSTGNAAVQQVIGAMKYYDCNRSMVVTTSYFTNEAISLAKANKTELISKEQLQELLLKYLRESWF